MMHKAWSSIEELPYCFSRSSVNFQGHIALKIVEFDPNWAFPDCNSSLNAPMAMKCCTKLETAKKRCPIVFQGHPSDFKVTGDKTSPILTQIRHFRTIGRSQLSNPSDLPCLILGYVLYIEHISCVIMNCGQHQLVGHPSSFLNSSWDLTGGKHYQKITITIFRFVLQEENITRKLLSLSLDLFFEILLFQVTFLIFFSCDQAALQMVFSVCLSVRLSVRPSVCLSVCPSHLFDYVPIIVSSWNFQELLPMTNVRSMQKVKVRGQRSRSQRSQPNLTVSGL